MRNKISVSSNPFLDQRPGTSDLRKKVRMFQQRPWTAYFFDDGSSIIFRLSGTGTNGATIRIYLELFEPDVARHILDAQEQLQTMITAANQLSEISQLTGRNAPTVIT